MKRLLPMIGAAPTPRRGTLFCRKSVALLAMCAAFPVLSATCIVSGSVERSAAASATKAISPFDSRCTTQAETSETAVSSFPAGLFIVVR